MLNSKNPMYLPPHPPHLLRAVRNAEEKVWQHHGINNRELKIFYVSVPLMLTQRKGQQKQSVSTYNLRVFELVTKHDIVSDHHKDLHKDNDTPIILVHGGGGSPVDFAPLLQELQDSNTNQRIYLVERPGNGISPGIDYSQIDNLANFSAQLVQKLLMALPESPVKAHFVGSSMGGATVVWFALRYPHQVASLALLGCPAGLRRMVVPPFLPLMAIPGLANLLSQLVALLPLTLLYYVSIVLFWLIFKIPRRALSREYLQCFAQGLQLSRNVQSFLSLGHHLWRCSRYDGWTWQQLATSMNHTENIQEETNTCHHSQTTFASPRILFVEGCNKDPFLTELIRCHARQHLSPQSYMRIGHGHMPWFDQPQAIAEQLLLFWATVANEDK